MTPHEILDELSRGHVLLVGEGDLEALLKEAKLLRQADTFVNGIIRVM